MSAPVLHGLPERVIFCSRCVMSNQRPSTSPELRNRARAARDHAARSRGPGKPADVVDGFVAGHADAIALGTLLHFKLAEVAAVKAALAGAGIEVR